jgi:hypothetical protein
MKANMRRNFPGEFAASNLAEGAWRLARDAPAPVEVWVRGASAASAAAFGARSVRDLCIEWHGEGVELSINAGGQPTRIEARSIIVHEPLVRLYENLPLAKLDAPTRRFWHRVFALVRIPGGRALLGMLARRRR